MGMLVNGKWQAEDAFPTNDSGQFIRRETTLRNWITPDGSAGPSGKGGFRGEARRYHLYVSLACPWAHRTLIFRRLKRLEDAISVSIVDPFMGDRGWAFTAPDGSLTPGSTRDHLYRSNYLADIYLKADPEFTGRVTVPVLWDKRMGTLVNNESSEIIRMLNSAFDDFGDLSLNFYPETLRPAIDEIRMAICRKITEMPNGWLWRCASSRCFSSARALVCSWLRSSV
jgi:putative glutathione S-transferase